MGPGHEGSGAMPPRGKGLGKVGREAGLRVPGRATMVLKSLAQFSALYPPNFG